MSAPNNTLAVPAGGLTADQEEARRQAIRARELLYFARHVQKSRQRLKEHDEHLAWVNRQVTQKLYRQRLEQAQWEADRGHLQVGTASATTTEESGAVARLAELERTLAEERAAHESTQAQLAERVAANGHAAQSDLSAEQLAILQKDMEALRQELASREETLQRTAHALSETQAELDRLRQHELQELRTQLEGHQSELEQTRQALAAAQEQLKHTQESGSQADEAESLRQEIAQLKEALAEREREHAETQVKLTDLQELQSSAVTQQGGQNKALVQEIEQLNKLLAERDEAHSEAALQLSSLKRTHQTNLGQLQQELEETRQQFADLERARTEAIQALEQERAAQLELRKELAALQQQLAEQDIPATSVAPPVPIVPPPVEPPPPPARTGRPLSSGRIPRPPDLTPTVIAPTPAALRPSSHAEIPAGFDLPAVEAGLTALCKEIEADRRAVEDELLRPDELRAGLRVPIAGTADFAGGTNYIQKAREMLKAETERLKRQSPVVDKPAADRTLPSRRAAVESSPIFELPPLKPSPPPPPEKPPEPPPKVVPARQRGTLHGLRKWLGEK